MFDERISSAGFGLDFSEIGQSGAEDKGWDVSIDGSGLETDTLDERTSSSGFWLDFTEICLSGAGDKGGDRSIDGSMLQANTFDERTSENGLLPRPRTLETTKVRYR